MLALALPIFLATGLPLLGWGAAAFGWIAQRLIRDALNKRAAASKDPRTVAGLLIASMIGRAWLIALTIFGAGLADAGSGAFRGSPHHRLVHALLHGQHGPAAVRTPMSAWLKGLSTKQKLLLAGGIYLGITLLLFVIAGSAGKNDSFQPQDEFKLDPWISIKIGSLDLSINRAVLYLFLGAVLTGVHDDLDRTPHAGSARTWSRPRSRPPTASCATTSPRGT